MVVCRNGQAPLAVGSGRGSALAVHQLLRRRMPRALAAGGGRRAAVILLTVADLVDDPDTWRPTLEGAEAPGRSAGGLTEPGAC